MKGIILAGGSGTRLYLITKAVSKQFLPIYDKPLVYYPLSVLMLADIHEVLVIFTPHDLPAYRELMGDGSDLGMPLEYAVQEKSAGLAQAFTIGRDFLSGEPCVLVLGDNMFHGQAFNKVLKRARVTVEREGGAVVFGYPVKDARAFGVVEFYADHHVIGIEEKYERSKSYYAVPSLYFYDGKVTDVTAGVELSARGELEITSVNYACLAAGALRVELMGRGMAWLDIGTPEGMLKAAEYVETVQSRQGYYIAYPEEPTFRRGFIDAAKLRELGEGLSKTAYGQFLISIADAAEEGV